MHLKGHTTARQRILRRVRGKPLASAIVAFLLFAPPGTLIGAVSIAIGVTTFTRGEILIGAAALMLTLVAAGIAVWARIRRLRTHD